MTPEPGGGGEGPENAALREELALALATDTFRWRLTPALRRHREAALAEARTAQLRRLGVFGPLNYVGIVAFAQAFLVGRPAVWTMALEYVAVPALVLLIARLFYRVDASSLQREGAALTICGVIAASMTAVFASGPAESVALNLMFVSCVVSGTIVVTRQPLLYSVAYVVAATLGLLMALALRTDAALQAKFYPLAVLVSTSVPTLIAIAQLEQMTLNQYLRDLAKTLKMEDLASTVRALDDLSLRDPLTGAGNRRRFERDLEAAGAAGAQHALLLVDIDHFKMLNDRHGHPAGDACLQLVARVIETSLRPADSVARIGGDEFAVLLAGVGAEEAGAIAQRICVQMQQLTIGDAAQPSITLSIGGALSSVQFDPDGFLARADAALYEAKRAGRACVRGFGPTRAEKTIPRDERVSRNVAA